MAATLLTPSTFRLPLRPTASLHESSFRFMLLGAAWMAVWYGAWLWLAGMYGERNELALAAVSIGFTPLLLWSLFDYRRGLILTTLTTPLLVAPIIPHGFTQGFGDWFAICSSIGFLLRHPHPRSWLALWRPGYQWLALILLASFISLAGVPLPTEGAHYGIKYGFAEIAGYCLNFAFLTILVNEIKDERDFKAVLRAVAAAFTIITVYSLAGIIMSVLCVGGYYGGHNALTTNQSITSVFGSANYHAAYLMCILPLAFMLYLHPPRMKHARFIITAAILLTVLFVQAAISRAAFLVLVVVLAGWFATTRLKKGTRLLSSLLVLMLPLTFVIWWYPACTCPDVPDWVCPYMQPASPPIPAPSSGEQDAQHYVLALDPESGFLRTPKAEGGWRDKVRLELVQNALSLWKDHPVAGVGVGLMPNYSYVYGQYNRAHNIILTIAAEQGTLGIIAWGGWIVYLMLTLWRARPAHLPERDAFFFLVLALVATIVESLFMDFYRMLWVWQLSALILTWPVTRPALNLKPA